MYDKQPLHRMFSRVTPSYDFINRISTFGFDRFWRKKAAKECLKNRPEQVLDLCCGTGDLTLELRKKASPETNITALDFSENMISAAKRKAKKYNYTNIEFIHADVSEMPFPDNFFDSIGISFAFRNLTYQNKKRDKFLQEILRVLKPGGRFVIIETSQPENRIFRKLLHIYLKLIIAPLGGLISGQHGAYKYLAHSASNYYNTDEICSLLINAGFKNVKQTKFLQGISCLHIGNI